jgi:hypothetical protein
MITEERKDRAAKINGLDKERYEDKVRAAVREEMFPEDEIAILRKSVAKLFELVASLHPGEINNAEFAEYNNRIEEIKNKKRGT